MRALTRPDTPAPLAQHGDAWADRWLANHAASKKFRWPQHEGRPLNQLLLPALLAMTQAHCAFCDGVLGPESPETIDHFRPKARFPEHAFRWPNLFSAYATCQQAKGERWDEKLLKPDAPEHSFSDFFLCDADSGEVHPNPAVSATDRARAQVTIEILELNDHHRPQARRTAWGSFRRRGLEAELDDYSYRFFFEALER